MVLCWSRLSCFRVFVAKSRTLLVTRRRRSRPREIFPLHQREVLRLQEIPEALALDEIEIGLPPCGSPVWMVPRRAPHLLVVVRQVQDQLVDPWRQRGEELLVRRLPFRDG